jgi:hypothetical protein
MNLYIVCEARANHSRIHFKICQHRCKDVETCTAFRDFMQSRSIDGVASGSDGVSLSKGAGISPATV